MEPAAVLTLMLKASGGFFNLWAKTKAEKAAKTYLRAKYSLRDTKSILEGCTTNYPLFYTYAFPEWSQTIRTLMRLVQESNAADEECCVACGELAMFVTLVSEIKGEIDGDGNRVLCDVFERVSILKNTETYKSLIEMGRGRGGEYALKLIKQELKSAFDPIYLTRTGESKTLQV